MHLVFFEDLQFHDAEEQIVLLVARGTGGCDAFALHQLRHADDLQGAVPPGSRHVPGTVFSEEAWIELKRRGERGWLPNPKSDDPARAVRRYIAEGEKLGVITRTNAPLGDRGGARRSYVRPTSSSRT